MHNVFREIVLAAGNKNFASRKGIGAVGLGHGARPQEGKVRTCMGLREAHGAAKAALVKRRQPKGLLRFAPVSRQQDTGPRGKRGIEVKARIGGKKHFLQRHAKLLRHALPAEVRVPREAHPTPFGKGLVSGPEARGRVHNAAL